MDTLGKDGKMRKFYAVLAVVCVLGMTGGTRSPECPSDIHPTGGDGQVDIMDLIVLINSWGLCPTSPASCDADFFPAGGDGIVNIHEIIFLINNFGPCEP